MASLSWPVLAATLTAFLAIRFILSQAIPRIPLAAARRLLPEPATSNLMAAALAVVAGMATGQAPIGEVAHSAPGALAAAPSALEAAPDDAVARLRAFVRRMERDAPPMTPMPAAHAIDDRTANGLPDVETMIARLAARLAADGSDADGWRTLGWSYFSTANYADAIPAYRRALELRPDDIELKAATAEAMTKASDDRIEPAALGLFEAVLSASPNHPRARFYKGLAREQAGDSAGAVAEWAALLDAHPDGAEWTAEVRSRLAAAAERAGVTVPAQKPMP